MLWFEGYILLFTPILLESQTMKARGMLRNHLVHPLILQMRILQMRETFIREKTARWSDMSQFSQLDSDPGPQTPSAETPAFSDDGKRHGLKAAKEEKK